MLLYVWSLLLYAAVYGADVVVAMLDRRNLRHAEGLAAAGPADDFVAAVDISMGFVRLLSIVAVAGFALTKLPLGGGTYLAVGAVVCLGLRRAIPTAGAFQGRELPLLSIRTIISTIGMFYLISSGMVR
jgi:hypothetical protein